MKAAFVIFNQMTTLDFIGIYDPLTRLKTMGIVDDFNWRVCALEPTVTDDRNLRVTPDRVGESLAGFDILVVPGGYGTRKLYQDLRYIGWIRTAVAAKLKVSVCTGSLLLGAAGFLKGRRATTHPKAYDLLRPFCSEVVSARIVEDGDVITGGGVTAGIDTGLHVVERIAGVDARKTIAEQMDYPYDSLSGHRAFTQPA